MSYNNDESIDLYQTNNKAEITTTWLEVESLNGKEFTENSGKIDIYLPPNIRYFDPSQSYLSFDLEIENSDGTPLKLLRQGASSLIRSIRIYSAGNSGKLLEEIDNYSTYVDILYQYTLSLVGDKDKKSMTELVETWNTDNEALHENQYPQFLNSYAGLVSTHQSAKTPVKQRIQLPLHTGIFRKSEVFANALFNGIRIEIQLRTTKEAFITPNNCRTASVYGSKYYARSAQTFTGDVANPTIVLENDEAQGIDAKTIGAPTCPFSVGQNLTIWNTTFANSHTMTGSIGSIIANGTNIDLYCNGTFAMGTHNFIGMRVAPTESTIAGTYKISNLSMVVCEISPPSSWENQLVNIASSQQGYNYDIITPVNYIDSVQSGNVAIVSQIPVVNTRIKSIISAPVPVATASYVNNTQSPTYDRFTNYQYFYLNINQPNELVPLTRVGSDLPEQIHLDQVEKGISGIEYPVNNLRHFKDCFIIARGVSYGKGSLNLESKDLMLKLNCLTTGLQNSTILNHYVSSIRRLRVANGNLEVFY